MATIRSSSRRLSRWAIAVSLAVGGVQVASAETLPGSLIARPGDREPVARPNSPNVIYIVLDDTGFSDLGCYGSEIRTPAMDALARKGLRFNNFHTRAICSPTRAAMLTGRNSHTVGVGNVANFVLSDVPHSQGQVTTAAATIAEILQAQGYRTFAIGKWHLTPLQLTSSRAQWPLARGFTRFYGFLDGMTDQFHPDIVIDNTPIEIEPRPGYHLSEDLIDKAIGAISDEKGVEPDRPFFLYLAFGATHSPHQAPKAFVDKYLTTYQAGWDEIRARRFARQKALGIIPRTAELAPRNADVRPWKDLTSGEKQVNAQFQAAYAGFLEHTDSQIGRLTDFLRATGQLDNTVIVLISDNGASGGGHELGTANELRRVNRIPETPDRLSAARETIGSEYSFPNYPAGWAQVSNTPFRGYKTQLLDGGVRDPLIVFDPREPSAAGQVRDQFVDVIDITPTILDIVGITAPNSYKGVPQIPLAGASFRPALRSAEASAPRDTQYFELLGQRSIWSNGWQAFSEHKPGTDFETDSWQLFDRTRDFTGLHDLAATQSGKLAELKERWKSEARKFGVLPLVDAAIPTKAAAVSVPKYETMRGSRPEYVFYPGGALTRYEAPQLGASSFTIKAELALTEGTASGVLIADGDRFSGYTLYAEDGIVSFEVSDFGDRSRLKATRPLDANVKSVTLRFDRRDPSGGIATIFYDDKPVGSGTLGMRPVVWVVGGGFSVGFDTSGPVSEDYAMRGKFAFPANELKRVIVHPTP